MVIREATQLTEAEINSLRAERNKIISYGTAIVEFGLEHLARKEETGELLTTPRHEITKEIAEQYAPAFRAVVEYPEYGLGKDATGLTAQQLEAVDLLLRDRLSDADSQTSV